MELRVLLLGYDPGHLNRRRSLCRGETFTGRRGNRPRSPGQGVVQGPVQQRIVIPDVLYLEATMHDSSWFDIGPGEAPVACEIRDMMLW